jgi:hypothetical protein
MDLEKTEASRTSSSLKSTEMEADLGDVADDSTEDQQQ